MIDKEQFWINFVPKLDTNLNLFFLLLSILLLFIENG